jgi:hypothetical protein
LNDVYEYIFATLDSKYHRSVITKETPHEVLVALKTRFARSNAYKEEMRDKWEQLATQKPSKDVDQWIDSWNTLRQEAISIGIKIEDADAARYFIKAVKEVLPIWWQAQYTAVIINEEKRDIDQLIESFRSIYREIGTKPSSSAPKASFSTWQGHEEAKTAPKNEQAKPFNKRKCPCGSSHPSHKIRTCYYFRPDLVPEGRQLSDSVKQRIANTLAADQEWKKWIDEEVAKAKPNKETADLNVVQPKNDPIVSFATTPIIVKPVFHAASAKEPIVQVPELEDRWIIDCGSSVHVCNNRQWFNEVLPYKSEIATGNTVTYGEGIGTARLLTKDPKTGKERILHLKNALYVPGFHTNLVSYAKMRQAGARWCQETDLILDITKAPVAKVEFNASIGLWLFGRARSKAQVKHQRSAYAVSTVKKSARPLKASGSMELWHRRLAHSSQQVLRKTEEMVEGVEIIHSQADKTSQPSPCPVCSIARAPRQISRRQIGRTFGRFGRIHFDLIQATPARNSHRWISHFYVEGVRFHWLMTHEFKPECQLAINKFIAIAKNWWNLPIKVFQYDNESSAGLMADYHISNEGIIIHHPPPNHPEMNGYAERAGGVILTRMRMLLFESKLPKDLWPEVASAAIWLLNRTPTFIPAEKRWVIPWEEVRREFAGRDMPKINLASVKLYGSKAYCRLQKTVQSDKMAPRAEVGFLIGFVASNLWKIWFPHTGKVRIVRDAIFDENKRYTPDFKQYQEVPMPIITEPQVLDDAEAIALMQRLASGQEDSQEDSQRQPDNTEEQQHDQQQRSQDQQQRSQDQQVRESSANEQELEKAPDHFIRTPSATPQAEQLASQQAGSQQDDFSAEKPSPDRETRGYSEIPGAFPEEIPLPPTPPSESPALSTQQAQDQGVEVGHTDDLTLDSYEQDVHAPDHDEHAPEHDDEDDPSRQLQQELEQPSLSREIFGNVDTANILEGKRSRRPKQDNIYSSYTTIEPPQTLHAFAAGLYAEKPERRHRDDLPPLPRHYKDVINHQFCDGFLAAMRSELASLTQKATYEVVDKPKDRSKQVLPLLWVFAYKFDADGYLTKLKARICVRGDLETITSEEKRAATLAARTARMLFSLIAAYDLDVRQRDAVTAFLNSKLTKEVYTQMPEGFGKPGSCWKLLRALYGLRISPRLWQQEAASVLQKLGLQQVPEDPCDFVGNGIIVFFYVDDILIASHHTARQRARELETALEEHWELTDHGEAEWFLNIRILRDRSQRKLWLCQDSYIASIAARYHLTTRAPVHTPLPMEDLKAYSGKATASEIHLFQQKVGSVGYATTITRVDAAKASAKLAQYLTNPGPQHQQAIDRLICYLYSTRYLAIEYAAGVEGVESESVQFASDASYGDHADRKSSAGYICLMYGGPVDWKASKQPTITTSTTEAELLGLSEAGKHLQWWRRMLQQVGIQLAHPIVIDCDNQRTIALINSDAGAFDTKLRHADIHYHWVRQEAQAGRITIRWVPTAQMVADGLTKILPRQKHDNFVRLLRLADVRNLIE